MRFVRALNNNAGVAVDDQGHDVVIFGKGLAFSLRAGQDVPADRVERIFLQKDASMLQSLLADIPQDYFDLTCEIIDYIQSNLGTELSGSLYVALMDHIAFVKERAEQGLLPKNSLTWEIGRYYPDEFRLGRKVVELLEEEFGIALNDDEAASIALHVINAENDIGAMRENMRSVKLVDDILQIISFQVGREPDVDSPSYQRLVAHVKFFVQRVFHAKEGRGSVDPDLAGTGSGLVEMVRASYPRAFEIADRVRGFVEQTCELRVADEEVSYLAINVQRVMMGGERG